MIIILIKKTGLIRKAWRTSIRFGNNEKFPHDYDDWRSALDTVQTMFAPGEQVVAIVDHGGGRSVRTQIR